MRAAKSRRRTLDAVLICLTLSAQVAAQAPTQFEVVSIKRNKAGVDAGGGIQNLPISSLIAGAAPVPVREVIGAPDWVNTERYDVTSKPPAGSSAAQRREMVRRMFADRMKLVAHIEQRERDTFALVLARSDGRLGPNLKPSSPECLPRPAGAPAPAAPTPAGERSRCVGSIGPNSLVFGVTTMDILVQSLGSMAGGLVNNRTGLQGFYSVELHFAPNGLAPEDKRGDEPPQFLTAIQEQLGLKIQPEKTMVPVLVIDSIERPSEN